MKRTVPVARYRMICLVLVRTFLGSSYIHFQNKLILVELGIEFYLFVSHGSMNDRGSTCKFRNARNAFQSLYLYFIKIVQF